MPDKPGKPKLIRDSFTMPKDDYALIDTLKARAIEGRRPAKKSELLRAGLKALAALDIASLVRALEALTPVKTGRPKADATAPAATAAAPPAPAATEPATKASRTRRAAVPKAAAGAKAKRAGVTPKVAKPAPTRARAPGR